MKNPTVLVAIGHGLYEPWLNILYEGQEKTWLHAEPPLGVSTIHYHGSPVGKIGWKLDRLHEWLRWKNRWFATFLRLIDRIRGVPLLLFIPRISTSKEIKSSHLALHIHFPDTYQNVRWKDLAILNYFINERSEDFILFTTTSSYIHYAHLIERVSGLDAQDFYGGVVPYEGAKFVAGNNRLISRSAVVKLLNHRSYFDPGYIEDVAMGKAFERLKIKLDSLPSWNFTDIQGVETLTEEIFLKNYHFRMKSGSFGNRLDVPIMLSLHNKIVNEFK
ncbi:hypothetical protein [Candidatus Planktophila dulcis]|uniref:hypothetical protein n=1 Tax=Candidatus Planktophila dulcis TaxID=1884914 RepID=UPI003CED20BF